MGGITLTDDVDRAYFLNAFYNYVEKIKLITIVLNFHGLNNENTELKIQLRIFLILLC